MEKSALLTLVLGRWAGYEKETTHDAVMERVDARGRVIGFSVMGVSRFKKGKPLVADLVAA